MNEGEFYARQISLSEIGSVGQQKLKNARVLVIGAGGLASGSLPFLVGAGVGSLTICDDDVVEPSNLHRQPIYTPEDIGRPKAEVAARKLKRQNPFVSIKSLNQLVTSVSIEALLQEHDLVIDGTDNSAANFLIHDACYLYKKPLIVASIHTFEGVLHRYDFAKERTGCLRCLRKEVPDELLATTCEERGVLGALPGVFGSLQAQVTLHHLLDLPTLSHGTSWLFDLRTMGVQKLRWQASANCILCSTSTPPSLQELHPESQEHYDVNSLDDLPANSIFIDIREDPHRLYAPIKTELRQLTIPFSHWSDDDLLPTENYLLVCTTGMRSSALAKRLRSKGFQAYSLIAGIRSLL